ncbi:hypothetical protein TNCV_3983301 [Trichonephila clavipes]|nr:hypothetical protein TNCV_3983301 [Trichonephila clavipes]
MWSMVAQRLTQITPPAATPDQLWQRVEAAWSAVPPKQFQSLFESMPMRVAASIDEVVAQKEWMLKKRLEPSKTIEEVDPQMKK